LFITILLFLVWILIFLLFPIFHRPWCCLNVFLLLMKLRSSLNQTHPINLNFYQRCSNLGMFV
jgi:hypothetical protein